MAHKRKADAITSQEVTRPERLAVLAEATRVANVPGPGHWLVIVYQPTSLFSLKTSLATSSVGKTLLVPTPYSIKMAFVDAAFRSGLSTDECAKFLVSLVNVDIRIGPPESACVTHTFVKIRQESRDANPLRPYIASIAYREIVHHHGLWRWAFDLAAGDDTLADRLVRIAPHVTYIGKRGSLIQFVGLSRVSDLGPKFTQPTDGQWILPQRAHVALLDDFGPEADFETLSSFTSKKPSRDKHRRFLETVIPLGLVNTGPGFSEYRTE
jgi:hypothetical protein